MQPDGQWTLNGEGGLGAARSLLLPPVRLPRDNLAVAVQAFWAAGLDLPDAALGEALAAASAAGRLESCEIDWQGQRRSLLLDVGHNPHAAAFLAESLRQQGSRPRVAVFGLLADKDLQGVLAPLGGLFERWYVAPLPSPRSRSAHELQQALEASGEQGQVAASVAAALALALSETSADTEIVIFGSFFCVADAILWLS